MSVDHSQDLSHDIKQTSGQMISLLEEHMTNPLPLTREALTALTDLHGRMGELLKEAEQHRLSYLHDTESENDVAWRAYYDITHNFIETIKKVRALFGYDLITAKDLVDAYRTRVFGFAKFPQK